jgi:hypothetical protein
VHALDGTRCGSSISSSCLLQCNRCGK